MATLLFGLFALLLRGALADNLFELTNAHATVYYDLTDSLCGETAEGDPFQEHWAEANGSGINYGIPYCEGQSVTSLKDLGTNRIVAMKATMLQADPAQWCGKEVEIIQEDGKVFEFAEGSLYIWDACEACNSDSIIDLSAKAFVQLKGGTCAGNNPSGLTVNVKDNNVAAYGGDSGSTKATTQASTTFVRAAAASEPPVVSSVRSQSVSVQADPSSSSSFETSSSALEPTSSVLGASQSAIATSSAGQIGHCRQ